MSSGQEGIITKDLINSPTRGLNDREFLNRPSSDSTSSSLKRDNIEVPEKPLGEKFKEAVNEATEKAHEYADAAEEKAYQLKERAKEYMNESSSKAKDYTRDAQIAGAVLADRAHRSVNDKVEKVKDYAREMHSSNTDEKDLRDAQQKAVDAGKRMENSLNSLIDATGEAMKNLGVKENEHGEFKNTDKAVAFGRGVTDQIAHSAPRIHDPAIDTSSTTPTKITSSEPFAPTENTTAIAESSYVPPATIATTTTTKTETAPTESSSSSGGFFSSLFRAASPAPDVSADSFEQPLTSERSFGAMQEAKQEVTTTGTFDEPLTSERAYGAEQEAKQEAGEPGVLESIAQSAKEWISGSSDNNSSSNNNESSVPRS